MATLMLTLIKCVPVECFRTGVPWHGYEQVVVGAPLLLRLQNSNEADNP